MSPHTSILSVSISGYPLAVEPEAIIVPFSLLTIISKLILVLMVLPLPVTRPLADSQGFSNNISGVMIAPQPEPNETLTLSLQTITGGEIAKKDSAVIAGSTFREYFIT